MIIAIITKTWTPKVCKLIVSLAFVRGLGGITLRTVGVQAEVGKWMQDDLCKCSFFLWFQVGGFCCDPIGMQVCIV